MKNKQIELMIFDLDGTVVDSGTDIANAINHTRKELGQLPYSLETILGVVGNGFENLIQRAIGVDAPEQIAQARTIFVDYYLDHLLDNTDVYPEMRGVLENLAHKKKILITNKRQTFVDIILEQLHLRRHFLEVICGDTFPYMKPDTRLIADSACRHGAPMEKTVVVGDGSSDILLARNGGGISCAHLRGLTKREILLSYNPDYCYENATEILTIFA